MSSSSSTNPNKQETATGDAIILGSRGRRGEPNEQRGGERGKQREGTSSRSVSVNRRDGSSKPRSRSRNNTRSTKDTKDTNNSSSSRMSSSSNPNHRTSRKDRRRSVSLEDQRRVRKAAQTLSQASNAGPPLRQARTVHTPYYGGRKESDGSLNDSSARRRASTEELKQIAANSSFSNRGGSLHTASFHNVDEGSSHGNGNNNNNAMDDSAFDFDKPIPHASTFNSEDSSDTNNQSQRSSLVNLTGISSLFARRGDLRDVDQSVNLMDAETGNYESHNNNNKQKKKNKGVMATFFGNGKSQQPTQQSDKMKDFNLGPDPTNRRTTQFYLQQQAARNDNRWHKTKSSIGKSCKPILRIVCSAPFMAAIVIIVTLVFWIPYMQDKVNSLPAPTAPAATTTPAPTPQGTRPPPAPTKAPATSSTTTSTTKAPKPTAEAAVSSTNRQFPGSSSGTEAKPAPGKDPGGSTKPQQYSNFGSLGSSGGEQPKQFSNFGSLSQKQDEAFMAAVTKLYNETQAAVLAAGITSEEDLNQPNSPQHNALLWLVSSQQQQQQQQQQGAATTTTEGGRQLEANNVRIVERYSAAVLFLAMYFDSSNSNETTTAASEEEMYPFQPVMPGVNASELTPEEMALLAYAVHGNMTSQDELYLFFRQMQTQGFNGTAQEFLQTFQSQMSQMVALNMTPPEELFLMTHPGGGSSGHNMTPDELSMLYYQLQLAIGAGPNATAFNMTPQELQLLQMMQHKIGNGTHSNSNNMTTMGGLQQIVGALMGNGTHNMSAQEMQMMNYSSGGPLNATMIQQMMESGKHNMTPDEMHMMQLMSGVGGSSNISSSNLTPEELQVMQVVASHNATAEEMLGLFFNPLLLGNPTMRSNPAIISGNPPPPPTTRPTASPTARPTRARPQTVSLSTGSQNQNLRHLQMIGFMQGWMSEKDICDWQGIECDSNKQVVAITLTQSRLIGTVPSEIQGFQSLTSLDLSRNHLHGSIPAQLGPNLRVVALNNNNLNGTIPGLQSLANLERLDLFNNSLSGSIPFEKMANLSKLTSFNARHNKLSDCVAPELDKWENIEKLLLGYNKLACTLPSLSSLSKLFMLGLEHNQLVGPLPGDWNSLQSLSVLNLEHNKINGHIPTSIGDLKSLAELRLHHNLLSGPIPSEMENLEALTKVFLEGNKLTGGIPAFNKSITSLVTVRVYHNELTGNISSLLCSAVADKQLKYLAADCLTNVTCSCCHKCY